MVVAVEEGAFDNGAALSTLRRLCTWENLEALLPCRKEDCALRRRFT